MKQRQNLDLNYDNWIRYNNVVNIHKATSHSMRHTVETHQLFFNNAS
jgi:hypothetical protein